MAAMSVDGPSERTGAATEGNTGRPAAVKIKHKHYYLKNKIYLSQIIYIAKNPVQGFKTLVSQSYFAIKNFVSMTIIADYQVAIFYV